MSAILLYFCIISLLLGLASFNDGWQNKDKEYEYKVEGATWMLVALASFFLFLWIK
jgi:hypothetical protein